MNAEGRLERTNLGASGTGNQAANEEDAAQLLRAFADDQVAVLVLSAPGYRSGYGVRRTLQVLHQPRGGWPKV